VCENLTGRREPGGAALANGCLACWGWGLIALVAPQQVRRWLGSWLLGLLRASVTPTGSTLRLRLSGSLGEPLWWLALRFRLATGRRPLFGASPRTDGRKGKPFFCLVVWPWRSAIALGAEAQRSATSLLALICSPNSPQGWD